MSEESDTQVVMKVPQDIIAAQVQAAVAKVLMERGDDFITEMVKCALSEPATDTYGRPITRGAGRHQTKLTKFGQVLEKGIQEAATEEARAWLEEQKAEIKKAVRAYLGRTKKDVVASIADRIIDGLSTPYVSLRMTFGDDE